MAVFDNVTFNEQLFTQYMQEQETISLDILNSGILVPSKEMEITSDQSYTGTIPIYLPASEEADASNYDGLTDNVPTKLSNKVQNYVATARMKAWEENSFLRYLSNSKTPMTNLADNLVTVYYAQQWKKTILSIVKGVLGVAELAGHKTDVATLAGLDMYSAIEDLKQKALGHNMDSFGLAIMHSKLFTELKKQKVIEVLANTDKNAYGETEVGYIGNCLVMKDDDLYRGTGASARFLCYLIGRGSILTAPKYVDRPYAMTYDPQTKGGMYALYTKQAKIFHPNGFDFKVGNLAGLSPTNTELETSANWELRVNHKLAPFAELSVGA